MNRDRQRFTFLNEVFYLAFIINNRLGIRNQHYFSESARSRSIGATFKRFFKFLPGIAEVSKTIHPS